METTIMIKVEAERLDRMGHMNHKNYYEFLEKARSDWFTKAGFPQDEMAKNFHIGVVLLRQDTSFHKEARLNDELRICTTPLRLGKKSFDMKQEIYNQDHVLITESTATIVMFDTLIRKSIPVVNEISCHFKQEKSKC